MIATNSTEMISEPLDAKPQSPLLDQLQTIDITQKQLFVAALFIASQAVLAIAMRSAPAIATAHAVITAGAGLAYAATTRRIRNVSVVVAYIAGSEVLWRMNGAGVFYEFGKYSVVVILVVALARMRAPRNRRLALLYLGLLIPSIVLTFLRVPFDVARQDVGFNMSGPASIAVAVIFFANIRLETKQLRITFLALIGPVAGIGMLSLISTTRATADLEFGNGSNFVTSGGFGPNQVSAMFGLALMFLVLICLDRRVSWRARFPAFVLAGVFATQSALTFARGGIALAFAGICAAMFVMLKGSPRGRVTVVVVLLLSFVLGKFIIEPKLDAMTHGKLAERYSSTSSSGRDAFIKSELEMFAEYPVLGVGPGVGKQLRDERGLHTGASHTEYTRMLAEHGLFGVFALACLVVLGVRAIRQARELRTRAIASALVIWVGLSLSIYGVRLVAPAFVLGLAFAAHPLPERRLSANRAA